jgi:hypothetical protein
VYIVAAVLIAHIAAIIMTIIMIMHIRSKYTAVGRKEMVFFFYLYALLELLGIFLDTAIIPFSSPVYPVSVSVTLLPSNSPGTWLDGLTDPSECECTC